jgi:competence protein ComFC
MSKWIEAFLAFIYPPVCLVCNSVYGVKSELKGVCSDCLSQIFPIGQAFVKTHILNRLDPSYLNNIFVCTQFNIPVQKIIHHIKYEKMNHLAFNAGCYMRRFLPPVLLEEKIDMATPVPLHPIRERERGYNQSWFIAQGILGLTTIELKENILKRRRNTLSQTNLTRKERQENVQNAFELSDKYTVQGKSVLLIDDVVTTGATLNEGAQHLKRMGAKKVFALALSTPMESNV